MTPTILKSIETATTNTYPSTCWWNDEAINKDIAIAVKNGWVRRPSTTQCEWTEKGIEAFKAMNIRQIKRINP